MNTKFMKNLALGIVMIAGSANAAPREARTCSLTNPPDEITLTSRTLNDDWEGATYSFWKMSQRVDVHGNQIDLLYDNSPDDETNLLEASNDSRYDQHSLFADIGKGNCPRLVSFTAAESTKLRRSVDPQRDHCYLLITSDRHGSLTSQMMVLFHVRKVIPGYKLVLDQIDVIQANGERPW